jgi:hypothetical protein
MAPTHWFVGTDVGVWTSTDGGSHWWPYEAGLPNTVVSDLEIQVATRKLFAGTHGRGAWEVDISSVTKLIPADSTRAGSEAAPLPVPLLLDPPYPNPARRSTVLRWAAYHEGEVELGVYDVRGALVRDLGRLARGDGIVRTSTWFVGEVPSGVYFAVLRAGSRVVTRRIVVAK